MFKINMTDKNETKTNHPLPVIRDRSYVGEGNENVKKAIGY